MSSQDTRNMAVFCDFENVALGVRDAKYENFDIRKILERLLLKGSIVVKKAYCDWDRYKEFKARPIRVQACGCGCSSDPCEYSRWRDGYEIAVIDDCPTSRLSKRTT